MAEYIIQEGDTLEEIAKKLGYSVTDLVQYNQITDPNKIRTGEKLQVPAWRGQKIAEEESQQEPPLVEPEPPSYVDELIKKLRTPEPVSFKRATVLPLGEAQYLPKLEEQKFELEAEVPEPKKALKFTVPGFIHDPIEGFGRIMRGELQPKIPDPITGEAITNPEFADVGIGAGALSMTGGLAGGGGATALRVGLPEMIVGPYIIAGGVKAAKKHWPTNPVSTGKILDPTEAFAPKELMTFDKPSDLVKTYMLSPTRGVFSLMRRLGYSNKAFFDRIDTNSSSAFNTKVNNAMETGRLRGYDADYVVPDGLSAARVRAAYDALPKAEQALANEYKFLLDSLDRMTMARAATGPHGMTTAQIRARINLIERTSPRIKPLSDAYSKVMMANMDYMGAGTNAMLTKKQLADIKANQKNLVPFEAEAVDPKATIGQRMSDRAFASGRKLQDDFADKITNRRLALTDVPRANAFDVLMSATEIALRSRNLNGIQHGFIVALRSTGTDAVVPVTRKRLRAHPEWWDRVTMIRRGGVPQYYISSQFIRDTIKLDPHIATNMWFYVPSRTFQWGTTGYGAPWFAIKQFLRESTLASLLPVPKGFKGVGVPYLNPALGVFEQIARRSQKQLADSIYRSFDSGSWSWIRSAFGDRFARTFADRQAKAYLDSTYHAYQASGAAGVSMAKNPIRGAKNVFSEIARDIKTPYSTKVFAETWMNALDGLQSASNYAFWARNYRPAKKSGRITQTFLDELARETRDLVSDVMTSGVTYTTGARGGKKLISADLVNRGATTAALPALGKTAEWVRQNTVWFNAMVKGTEKIGRAYWSNPIKFTAKMQTGIMVPTTLAFFYTMSRGDQFVDYMVNGRSEYLKYTSLYIPDPRSDKPEDGWEIPVVPLEIAPLFYMYHNSLIDAYSGERGPEAVTQAQEIGKNFFGVTMPPLIAGGAALGGYKIPGTVPGFGEEVFSTKDNPYSFLPGNVEAMIRSFFGSAMDTYVGGINSFLEEKDVRDGMKEFMYRFKQKTPVAQNIQRHSVTDINEKYWERKKKLEELDEIYKTHIMRPGEITEEPGEDVVSKGGRLFQEKVPMIKKSGKPGKRTVWGGGEGEEELELKGLSNVRVGRPPVLPPTNPEYIVMAEEIHKQFESTGNNYGKMVSRLNNITKQVQGLKKVNVGSLKEVKENIENMDDSDPLKAELAQFDWGKRDSVRDAINYFERERVRTLKKIEQYVREVEDKLGTKLDELDPYESNTGGITFTSP
ncbi:MAG: LysM peptidoglycan-binding domain-containing protein [Nitrososphaera sp.]|nr:LysM peptidoglycan-binding domain-containing protein [Nitrososphaera sp.]